MIHESVTTLAPRLPSEQWIDLEQIATVEISSKDPLHPFENALDGGHTKEWRAASPGKQQIKLVFDTPQTLQRLHLEIAETEVARSQELALSATFEDTSHREIVRQQWTFSPGGSTNEVEDFEFNLDHVGAIKLEIDPGRHDKSVHASIRALLLS